MFDQTGRPAAAAVGATPSPANAEASDAAAPKRFFIRLRSSSNNNYNAAAGSSGDTRNTSSTGDCKKFAGGAEPASLQHAAKGLRTRRGCASAAAEQPQADQLGDPVIAAAAIAEEQRLLAAGIAAEATRGPPRKLVSRRVPHGNHKGWDPSLSYEVQRLSAERDCWFYGWCSLGRCVTLLPPAQLLPIFASERLSLPSLFALYVCCRKRSGS